MKRKLLMASAAFAAGAGAALWRKSQELNLGGKVVLITGGSHGLGLALARRFAQEGARLMLCARSEEELDAARRDLASITADVQTHTCDVADREQVNQLIEETVRRYGRIDVLVNNAGLIHVGPVDSMEIDDFREAMNVMFWGTVYTTFAAIPHIRQARGRIVNITSIGGKVSVPHLLPYSCAKFAAVAFSEGMRAELQGSGVKVVTIAPGLMRTGSHLNAVFNGADDGEAAWFSVGASLPGISMDAAKAARRIVCATRKGSAEVILGGPANFLARFHGLFPGATAEILGLINRALPHGGGGSARGSESEALRKPWLRALTARGNSAAREYLQPAARTS